MNALGVYIHVPFCKSKCAYCDFYSLAHRDPAGYADALIRQIKSKRSAFHGKFVDSIFIGGGTPSLLPPEDIADVIDALRSYADVTKNAEITIEANPGTLDSARLSAYRTAGVNRLSIGLQSADDEELFMLSRIHTKKEFEQSFMLARVEGFDNINVDIMYALPFQTLEKITRTLEFVADISPEHVSFYGLKIEENTPFGRHPNIDHTLPDEDTQVKMYINSCKFFEALGLKQYEISNFARPGRECHHNLKYWQNLDFIGFGPGAHSMVDMRMYSYKRDLSLFMADPTNEAALLDDDYELSVRAAAVQYVMLAMRTTRGVNKSEYFSRFGVDFEKKYGAAIAPYVEKKLMATDGESYHLTRRGMLVSNMILSDLLDFEEK